MVQTVGAAVIRWPQVRPHPPLRPDSVKMGAREEELIRSVRNDAFLTFPKFLDLSC
jgi:hypothetical protein